MHLYHPTLQPHRAVEHQSNYVVLLPKDHEIITKRAHLLQRSTCYTQDQRVGIKSTQMSRPYTTPGHQRPLAESPPATVRAYLASLLHERHGVPEDEAAGIADAWRLGRGAELATYDLQTFRDMFGSETGALLYMYARDGLNSITTDDTARGAAAAQRRPAAATHLTTLLGVDPLCKLVSSMIKDTPYGVSLGNTLIRCFASSCASSVLLPSDSLLRADRLPGLPPRAREVCDCGPNE